MPAVTRELSIAYGTLTTGGSTDYLIDGPYELRADYESVAVTWRVVVATSAEATFYTACAAVESAFRTINAALVIVYGSTTFLSLSHSAGTGYLARPSFRVLEEIQTGRSRRYEVSVTARRPADASGKSLLRGASLEVIRSPSGVRTLRAAGTYTCNGATGARATYAANVATFIGTITTALTGTWERSGDSAVSFDDEDKEARWSETYREVTYNQAVGVLNHAALVDQRLAVKVAQTAPGDARGAARWRTVTVSYAANVDRDSSTDLVGLYEGTIRPHLLAEASAAAGGQVVAMVQGDPSYDLPQNAIAVSIVCLALGSSNVIELRTTTRDEEMFGKLFIPVHSGDPFARIQLAGPARRIRTITTDALTMGRALGVSSGGVAGGGGSISGAVGGLLGGALAEISGDFGIFGMQGGTIGNGNYLTGIDISEGGEGGGGGSVGPGGGVAFSPGYQQIGETLQATPLVLGLPELQAEVTVSSTTKFYEFATVAKRGSGGGPPARNGGIAGSSSTATAPRNP